MSIGLALRILDPTRVPTLVVFGRPVRPVPLLLWDLTLLLLLLRVLWSSSERATRLEGIVCWKSVSALYAWHGLQIANVSIARQSTVPSIIHHCRGGRGDG